MNNSTPIRMMLIAFVLLVIGAVLPFLMVLQVIQSTLFLNFFSYGASIVGLFLGLYGITMFVRMNKK